MAGDEGDRFGEAGEEHFVIEHCECWTDNQKRCGTRNHHLEHCDCLHETATDFLGDSVASLRRDAGVVAVDYLKQSYTSVSPVGARVTGSRYQSISISGEIVTGFRESRAATVQGLDFTSQVVIDIGSNYGEISRDIARAGASLVVGVEFDPFFSAIAQLLSVSADAGRVVHICADATQFDFSSLRIDSVVCFSAWPFTEGRIEDLVAAGASTFILETHELPTDDSLLMYLDRLLPFFPVYSVIAQHAHGDETRAGRLVIAFGRRGVDLARVCPAYLEPKDVWTLFGGARGADAIDSGRVESREYWDQFLEGYRQFSELNALRADNPHWMSVVERLEHGADDPYLAELDVASLAALIRARFRDLEASMEGRTVPGGPVVRYRSLSQLRQEGADWSFSWPCSQGDWLDGWHRLFSAWSSGERRVPVLFAVKERPIDPRHLAWEQ